MDGKKEYFLKESRSSKDLVNLLDEIEDLSSSRNRILERHFYELIRYNIDDLEDRDSMIIRITGKEPTHPNAFLASSLGFSRSTWNKKYENLMSKFGLGKKLKHQTFRNMKHFEKLKMLISKYFELTKK
ncbi:hypothetical protein NGRA_2531 [Nosema granulosis]|uniref:Uncharacterized protein n=1 Tax=Nosema granulosis TaxID=83296 RepID=A0A9P6KYJ3_9MICR|nr:hypothetical protein NGRA_2531 [Nosema granulosis]